METKIADCIFCNVMEKLFLYETNHSIVLINLFQVEGVDAIVVVPKDTLKLSWNYLKKNM
jgi:diadenosine tetraphosphate (Ap4A) HIT family hydrolase